MVAPQGNRLLKEIAEELRTKRTYDLDDTSFNSLELPPQYPLGQDWVPRFILRHPHPMVAIGRRIESVRMDGSTKEVLGTWFEAYSKVVQEQGIKQEKTYNMVESEFSIGTMESTRIILDSPLHTKHQAHPGRQEWVSMVECICADGSILPPLGIFKGKKVLQNWIPGGVLDLAPTPHSPCPNNYISCPTTPYTPRSKIPIMSTAAPNTISLSYPSLLTQFTCTTTTSLLQHCLSLWDADSPAPYSRLHMAKRGNERMVLTDSCSAGSGISHARCREVGGRECWSWRGAPE